MAVQTLVRRRVLSLFERKGLLTPEAAENMRQWQHGGGFSFDASVVIDASDRAGLKRLVYRLPKARPGGQDRVALGVSELLDRLAALISPPRRYWHCYLTRSPDGMRRLEAR